MFILFAVRNRCNALLNRIHSSPKGENNRNRVIPPEMRRLNMSQMPAVDEGAK